MRVVVAGASGFVGKSVQDALLGRSSTNSSLETYYLTSQLERNSGRNGNWVSIKNDADNIQGVMRDLKPEIFVNLAWKGIPEYSFDNSSANIFLNSSLIHSAYLAGARRVITTGSCWEYLNPSGAVVETASVDEGNFFKVAKNTVRKFGELSAQQFETEFIWLRLFYVFGRHQNQHSLLPSLISQGLNGQCPEAKNLASKLDFVNVEFVAETIVKLIEREILEHKIYNIGSGTQTPIVDILNSVREYFGYTNFENEPKKYHQDFFADTSRIEKITSQNKPTILQSIPILIEDMKR